MQLGLPDSYPSTCSLPFNRESLERDFQIAPPDQDPGGAGVWLLLCGQQVLTADTQRGPELPSAPGAVNIEDALYIGNWQGRPCRLLKLSEYDPEASELQAHSLQSQNPQIPLALLSLAGVGQMILHWEASSCFCGYCGQAMTRLAGEWGKQCSACGKHHFPRIHPCVIGLVVKGDEILLVRKPEWQPARFGLVAGFVEFGESLEQAMVREIAEETAIQVINIRYIGSQCWPFPSQIMNGFVCDYAGGEIKLQDNELVEASWYRLNQLPKIPPRRSIARYLIDQAADYLNS